MDYPGFGERVRQTRLQLGMSQSALALALANATGTRSSKSLVSRWEVGRVSNPKMATVLALRDILNVSLDWLVLGIGSPTDKLDSTSAAASSQVDVDVLSRALQISLLLRLSTTESTARTAAFLYVAISQAGEVSNETLLALVSACSKTQ
ncbi:MAG: helix-turn-helix domain-containing protein [Pseudomonadota bacterium]